jgi:hypothetical protein
MRLSGVVEREALAGGLKRTAFAAVQVGFPATWDEALAARDRRTRQVGAEIARTVQGAPTPCPPGASIGAG